MILIDLWEQVLSGEMTWGGRRLLIGKDEKAISQRLEICERAHNLGFFVLIPFDEYFGGPDDGALIALEAPPPQLLRVDAEGDWHEVVPPPPFGTAEYLDADVMWRKIAAHLEAASLSEDARAGRDREHRRGP